MSRTHAALAATSATNPYQLEELFVKLPPHPGRDRLAVAHRTGQPGRPGRRAAGGSIPSSRSPGRASSSAAPSPWSWRCRTPAGSSPGGGWCVLARHRLQRLCYEARLHTRSGRLPLILWIRPTKVGERAWVLCRAGICAEDFEAHIGELRAACYARDARVTRNRRWSHLITIDIIRRDTLAASNTHHLPAGAADRALPAPPAAGPRPAPGRRARPSRITPARRSPDTTGGPPAPDPSKEAPAMTTHRHRTRPLPPVPTFPFSMFDPVHLGQDEYGEHVYVNLAERNMLLGGEPGAGKSSAG